MLNSNLKSERISPKSIGLGGSLYSLVSAFSGINQVIAFKYLCPVWAVLLFPLSLFFPVLTPIFVFKAIKQRYQDQNFIQKILKTQSKSVFANKEDLNIAKNKQNAKATEQEITPEQSEHTLLESLYQYIGSINLKSNLKKHRHILILTQIFWYVAVLAIYHGSTYFADLTINKYINIAKEHQVLQIATPEQIAMSQSLSTIYSIALGIGLFIMLVCMSISVLCACNFIYKRQQLKEFLLKNLPGIMVVFAFAYCLITIIERYYAHYRMIAIEAMLKNLPYFDPSWSFILLRCYVGHAIIMALIIMIFMSLRILPSSFRSTKKA